MRLAGPAISDRVDFGMRDITRDGEGDFRMIKG